MVERPLNSFEDMRVEPAVHRLVIRAMLTFMACNGEDTTGAILAEICSMLEGTGPYSVVAPDLDDELRQAAIDSARQRMARFTADIDKLPIARN